MTWAQQTALGYGLLGFLVIWGTVVIPQLLSQYARFGRVLPRRLAGTAAVTLYACLALAVVFLPLPGPGTAPLEQVVQPVPFQWVSDVGIELTKHDQPASEALFTQTFQQLAMNVLLFVPLGLFGRARWKLGVVAATLLGFGLSLLVEICQVTANFGTAPFAYRIFDVDDLMANTLGALLGWIVAALALALLSSAGAPAAGRATWPARGDQPRPWQPAGPVVAGRAAVPHAGLPTRPLRSRP
ncbi:VanZ family protein [Prauserella oleivorans]|uniref:VanZ family protein n=1 Tax=Prauserella oleivorans TaxID=1478153 RepID=A0ABW5WGQ2_9PSEU